MDYSILLGVHYPRRIQATSGDAKAASGVPQSRTDLTDPNLGISNVSRIDYEGAVRNFSEIDIERRFKEVFPAVTELVEKLRISEQAK
jgi:hypothetical protein